MKRLRYLALLIGCAGFSISAWAHDPGLSSAAVTVADRDITAVAVFNARDLAALTNEAHSDYAAFVPDILRIRLAGQPAPATVGKIDKDQNENVTFHLTFARTAAGPLEISSGVIDRLPFGHREFVSVHTAGGVSLGDRLLSARENLFQVSIPEKIAPAAGARFADFFFLGIRHILTGYDHLLFLFGLLIVCRNARGALALITCFTVAHSLTLALSTFGLVNLQSRLVEPAIAASIVYVGIENLSRGGTHLSGRWILTFLFGLIHGLGFATVLRELGVASSAASAVVPLVGFNLGVEAGQLSVAAIILPIIWKLRQRAPFIRVGVPACSLVIALAGGYWLIERTLLS